MHSQLQLRDFVIVSTLQNRMRLINEMLQIPRRRAQGYDYGYWPYLCAFLASIVYPTSWLFAIEHGVAMAQTTLLRGFISILANYWLCKVTHSDTANLLQSSSFKYLLARAVIYGMSSLFVGAGQFILPMSTIYTIYTTGTLFVFVLDYLFNGVKVSFKQGIGIFMGMAGAIISSNCKLILLWIGSSVEVEDSHRKQRILLTNNLYVMTAFGMVFLASMFVWAYATIITKKLKQNNFQANYITGIVYTFMGALLYLPTCDLTQDQSSPIHSEPRYFYLSILFTGVPLLLEQWLTICAFSMAKNSGVVSMIYFNTVAVGYLVGLFRYGEKSNSVMNVGLLFLAAGLYQALFNSGRKGEGIADGGNQLPEAAAEVKG